jgi:HAMP domain-containing protein
MRLTFGVKLGLFVSLLAVGSTSAGLISFFFITRQNVWGEMSARLGDIGRAGQFLLTEEHRQAIDRLNAQAEAASRARTVEMVQKLAAGETDQPLSPEDVKKLQGTADFQLLVNVMRQIKNATRQDVTPLGSLPQVPSWYETDPPKIRYVYLLATIPESKDRTVVKFIVDGDNEVEDSNGNGQIDKDETATEIGQIYNISAQPGAMKAFDGKVHASEESFTDEWGEWMSSYTPILRKDGSVAAVMGVDMSATSQVNVLRRLLYLCLAVIGASLILSVAVAFLMSRWISRPIVLLREGAERVKNRDYDTSIVINSNDELGILASTFNQMVEQVKDHARTLEDKVNARTAELQQTLEKVQALKSQQDADYYLTNLLASPLFKNYNRSKVIDTKFYIKQKKEFTFRTKAGELGGDMCVTGNLKFRGKRYTMFVNADAMGKSMQGAGGALIMGSVVNSIMARSASNKRDLDMEPDAWLYETYQEMQNVFLTFDGSMYVSCILGLIADETGMLLYFNAEHPGAVLYRNGRAEFIDEDVNMRKLGSQIAGEYSIIRLQLEPGDVVVLGSDGRDDINLTPTGTARIINEDSNLFLRIVEESDADLARIVEGIQRRGEIIDDLSLIRIAYQPSTAVNTSADHDPAVALQEIVELMRSKRDEAALERLEQFPEVTAGAMFLYYRGLCLERLGRTNEALYFLEKAVTVDGRHLQAVKLLGNVYFKMGKYQEAAEALEKALEMKPDEEKLVEALDRVKRRLTMQIA